MLLLPTRTVQDIWAQALTLFFFPRKTAVECLRDVKRLYPRSLKNMS
jgi:hypothetical protein